MSMLLIKKNSHEFEKWQKEIVIDLLQNFFERNLPNGNGCYLSMLNLNKISMQWCLDFNYENGNYGAWNPFFYNSIFLMPGGFDETLRKFYPDDSRVNLYNSSLKRFNEKFINVKKDGSLSYVNMTFENSAWISDLDKYTFIEFILGNSADGLMRTICHELYHKWQFSASPLLPIFYIANFFVQIFLGYTNSSKSEWFIEGDVREYVDNEDFSEILEKFSKAFQLIKKLSISYKQKMAIEKYDQELNKETKEAIKSHLKSFYENKSNKKVSETFEYQTLFKIMKDYEILNKDFIKFVEETNI